MKTGAENRPPSRLIEALKALQPGVQPIGPSAAIGYSLIGAIAFLGGLGYLFDRWQGTTPTGLVVGMRWLRRRIPAKSWAPLTAALG
jgi:hypothetical protein